MAQDISDTVINENLFEVFAERYTPSPLDTYGAFKTIILASAGANSKESYLLLLDKSKLRCSLKNGEFAKSMTLQRLLHENDVPTPAIFSYTGIKDHTSLAICEYMPNPHPDVYTSQMYASLGQTLAKFHTVPASASFQSDFSSAMGGGTFEGFFKSYYSPSATLPKGLIHNDIKPDNIAITKDGKALLLDLDITSKGPFVCDIAQAIKTIIIPHSGKNAAKNINIISEEYDKTRKISEEEKAFLRKDIPRFGIWMQSKCRF